MADVLRRLDAVDVSQGNFAPRFGSLESMCRDILTRLDKMDKRSNWQRGILVQHQERLEFPDTNLDERLAQSPRPAEETQSPQRGTLPRPATPVSPTNAQQIMGLVESTTGATEQDAAY